MDNDSTIQVAFRWLVTIILFILLLAIPFLGWWILIFAAGHPPKSFNDISYAKGIFFKTCPKCGHAFMGYEHGWDSDYEWQNYKCSRCGQISRRLNWMLLGVCKHIEWTGSGS